MDTEIVESGPEIHAVLVEPLIRLSRWATRRKRGVDDTQLHAAAWGMLGAFDELLALPVTQLGIEVYTRTEPAPSAPADISGDTEVDRATAMLESVRNIRSYMGGAASASLVRALHARNPLLASTFEERRVAAVARLSEWEAWLVCLGAGSEEDAAIGMSVVPAAPEDLPVGRSSVPFDL